jgi:type IV pilus assembly protein PilX
MKPVNLTSDRSSRFSAKQAQRGVSLIFALMAVLVMLIAAVAIVRSFNTSLFQSGNLAFKRDLTNQSERALQAVYTAMSAGGALASEASLEQSVSAENYSAKVLTTNAQGIPDALLTNTAFAAVGVATKDIVLTDTNGTEYGTVRYVIERLCNDVGSTSALGADGCVLAPRTSVTNLTDNARLISAERANVGGTGGASGAAAAPRRGASSQPVVYRVSVRVTGARGTQGFYQATLAR